MILDIKEFEIKNIIIEALETYEYQIRLKQINLIVCFDQNLPKFIKNDSNRVKQILLNLLQNALKFTNEGGTIRVFITFLMNQKVVKLKQGNMLSGQTE